MDVIKFLGDQSVINDTNSPAGERGVNIILNLNRPGIPAPVPPANDEGEIIPGAGLPLINLTLHNVVLLEAIKYIVSITGLKYRIESSAVVITPVDIVFGALITKIYRVHPSLGELIKGATTTNSGALGAWPGGDVRKFFVDAGVPFPDGTSIKYQHTNLLVVVNTAENHQKFEETLTADIIPAQVKVQVDHLEITDSDSARRFQRRCPTAEELRGLPFDAYRVRSSLTVITKSGAEAEAKSLIAADGGQTNEALGAVLRCTPLVGPDGYTIDLTLLWESSAPVRANPPFIGRMSLAQSLAIWDGEAIVMPVQAPGAAQTAQKPKPAANPHYVIITPTLIDPAGRRINKNPFPPGGVPSNSPLW